jgi:hypothetical protein
MFHTLKYKHGFIMIAEIHNITRIYGVISRKDKTIRSKDMSLMGVKRWISANM